ncbi:hypothetical protein [Nocardia sp. NPDC004750]
MPEFAHLHGPFGIAQLPHLLGGGKLYFRSAPACTTTVPAT